MMHQYAAILEKKADRIVGFHLLQHPETTDMLIEELEDVLKQDANDQGLIDSKMSDFSQAMIRLINSFKFWFNERQSIETIARDLGDPNMFATLNMDARNWEDVRWLVF